MNKLFIAFCITILAVSCGQSLIQSEGKPFPGLFTVADADKVLGEKSHLTDSSFYRVGETLTYQCAFTANKKDTTTGKTGAVYFLISGYAHDSLAHNRYVYIKQANEAHEGVKTLQGLGDEAYFHSDGQNFYFIMVRKGNIVFNLKVNKLTSHTSQEQFNEVAKKIAAGLGI